VSEVPSINPRPASPVFVRTTHELLFHISNKFIGFTAITLESESDSARWLLLRHRFAI
jgi:hypothetical protein